MSTSPKPVAPFSSTPSADMVRASRVFTVLAMTYHNRWSHAVYSTEREAEVAMALWGEHMRPLTDAQIEQACRAMVTEYPSWPPTLGEFLALAQGYVEHIPERYIPPVYKPRTAESKAMASQMLADLKRLLAEPREGAGGE